MKVPRFVYDGTTLNLSRPTGKYTPGLQGIGAGVEESAAMVRSGWVTAWSDTVTIPIRLMEAEWSAFKAFLKWALPGNPFDFRPDKDVGTTYTCYLVKPSISDVNSPAWQDYPGAGEFIITIRRTD